ncbi:MAG: hypothetical protein ABFR53_05770 [Actinomycetota bacterium]
MSDPQDPYDNLPGWTDPYADLTDLSGNAPLPPMEPPATPPAQPPGSPLLTGLIIGLLLIALSVAVFQVLGSDDGTAAGPETTTTTTGDGDTDTTAGDGQTTTTGDGTTATTVPGTTPYPPVGDPIPVEDLKLKADGFKVEAEGVANIEFGTDADTAIGQLVSSFGDSTQDTDWQVSTEQFGVCNGDFERIIYFGPLAAIVTKPDGTEIFSGYRSDLQFGDLTNAAASVETLSGLKIGDSVADLKSIYAGERVEFSTDSKLGEIYEVIGGSTGNLLLWGPIEGTADTDRVIGIYAPDVCSQN